MYKYIEFKNNFSSSKGNASEDNRKIRELAAQEMIDQIEIRKEERIKRKKKIVDLGDLWGV